MTNRFAVIPAITFEQKLEPAAIALLAAISVHVDKHGNLMVSYKELCQMLGRSKGWVSKNMRILVDKNVIKQSGKTFIIVNDVQYNEHSIIYNNTSISNNNTNILEKTKILKTRSEIPDNFDFKPDELDYAQNHTGLDISQIVFETEKFKTYYQKNGKKMANWSGAWKNWMLNVGKFNHGTTKKQDNPKEQLNELTSAAKAAELLFGYSEK